MTFVHVNLGLVALTAGWLNLDINFGVVTGTVMWEKIGKVRAVLWKEVGEMRSVDVWKFDVDVGGFLFGWSGKKRPKLAS